MLRNLFLLVPFLLLVHVTSAVALPKCPGIYDGTWHNCEGSALTVDGDTYSGGFRHGKYHGFGTGTKLNGDSYVGEYRNGKKHGHGTYISANGDKYVGEYRNDQANGHGTITFSIGEKYVGEFRDDKQHGQATYTFPDDSSSTVFPHCSRETPRAGSINSRPDHK